MSDAGQAKRLGREVCFGSDDCRNGPPCSMEGTRVFSKLNFFFLSCWDVIQRILGMVLQLMGSHVPLRLPRAQLGNSG